MNKPRKVVNISIEGQSGKDNPKTVISFVGMVDFVTAAEILELIATRGFKKVRT